MNRKDIKQVAIALVCIIITVLSITLFGNAVTTISTNITTDGNLTVGGNATTTSYSGLATTTISGGLDLSFKELKNAVLENLANFPSSPTEGQFFWSTASNTPYWYDDANSRWRTQSHAATFVVAAATSTDKWKADYVCDGTADDVEIQAAIDALPSVGGRVIILEGNYTLSSGLTVIIDNVTLEGQGGSTVLGTSGMADTFITVGDTASANYFVAKNFKIDGTNQTAPGSWGIEVDKNGCGILFDDESGVGVANSLVDNVTVEGIAHEAIGYFGDGVDTQDLQAIVRDSTFIDFAFRGVHTHLDHSITVINCRFLDSTDATVDSALRHAQVAIGNSFQNINAQAEDQSILVAGTHHSVLEGNVFHECAGARAVHGWGGGQPSIINNYFYDNSTTIGIDAYGNALIQGNRFRDSHRNAIQAENGDDNEILNNTIIGYSNATYESIRLNSTSGNIVKDNVVRTDTSKAKGIGEDGSAGNNFIFNNYVTGPIADYAFVSSTTLFRDNHATTTLATYNTTSTITWYDEIVLIDASSNQVDLTLPEPNSWPGEKITIKAIDVTNSANVLPHNSENIDGANQTINFASQYDAKTFQCDGTNWWIIGDK